MLLLEAGPDYPDLDRIPEEVKYGYASPTDVMTSDHNWQFTGRATDEAQEIMVPRGKVTGGSSAINGQMFLREVPEDYETQHISGTCKMGPVSDPMATVDQYGHLHGMEGIRVVDASIMPDCIRANTNVTTMMIGELISDFIRQGK